MAEAWTPLHRVRTGLSWLWIIWAGILLAVLFVTSFSGDAANSSRRIWPWMLSMVAPTVGVVIAFHVGHAEQPHDEQPLRPFLVKLAFGCSATYLLMVTLAFGMARYSIGYEPTAPSDSSVPEWLAKLEQSKMYFAPVQGALTLLIGFLFASKQVRKNGDKGVPPGPDAPASS